MDARETPVRPLIKLGAGLALAAALAAGCAPPPKHTPGEGTGSPGKPGGGEARLNLRHNTVDSTDNTFFVDDDQGRRLLEGKCKKANTAVGDSRTTGPLKMTEAHCRLYQDGKFKITMDAPEATWDSDKGILIAEKSAHGVSADGKSVIDGQRGTWTAKSGLIVLEQAKLTQMKNGKVDFTAEGPRAEILDQVVTMPQGGHGRNADGQELTADHVRYHMKTELVDAEGHVVVTDEGVRMTGDRLHSNTKLQRNRVSGHVRTVLQSKRLKKNKTL